MTAKNTKTVDQVVAATIDTVTAAAVAQGFIPEQQAADAWSLSFDNIAHIPVTTDMDDVDYLNTVAELPRYLGCKVTLRDTPDLTDTERASLEDTVRRYETCGESLVENAYRASIAGAIIGGAALTSAASIAAEAFVVGLTGSTLLGSVAGIGLIFATAFAVFKFGDELLDVLRWISDRIAAAVGTVWEWVSAGWDALMTIVSNFNAK